MNICTTLEQSKKLVELGLDPRTADMHWIVLDGATANATYGVGFSLEDYNRPTLQEHIPACL